MNAGIIHNKNTQRSWKGTAQWHLLMCKPFRGKRTKLENEPQKTQDTEGTLPGSLILRPVLDIMLSMVKSPSAEKWHPWTNTPFWITLVSLRECPWAQKDVCSSLETLSRNPSCSGKYWAIWPIKSACNCSFCLDATFFIFLEDIPAQTSSWWIVVKCAAMNWFVCNMYWILLRNQSGWCLMSLLR